MPLSSHATLRFACQIEDWPDWPCFIAKLCHNDVYHDISTLHYVVKSLLWPNSGSVTIDSIFSVIRACDCAAGICLCVSEWVCVHASRFWIHFNEPHCTTQRCVLRGTTQEREYGGAGKRPTSVGGSGNELTVGVLPWGQAWGNVLILTKIPLFFSLSA